MSIRRFPRAGLASFGHGARALRAELRPLNAGASLAQDDSDQEATLSLPTARFEASGSASARISQSFDEAPTIVRPRVAGGRSAAALVSGLPSSSQAPGRVEPGTLLGNYRILRCLARGGMASVWVACHRSARGLSKIVTLKTILPELAAEPSFEAMFLQEARLASLIRHPNVCETFELIDIDGVLALSMEWVDGASLSRMLAASPSPLEPRIAARIAAQAAAGLHAAHELCDEAGRPMKLVHRDVSPQNILLSRDGHVRISDFGIAKAMSSMRGHSPVSLVQGKAAYLSPEQARDEALDRRSDIFSLGAVLYLAALGRRPFMRGNWAAGPDSLRGLQFEFVPPLRVDPNLPPPLAAIIVRAMQRDPLRRYQTAADMRRDLELWLSSSGPLIAEHDVARVLEARCGEAIEQQQTLIRAAMSWEQEARQGEADRKAAETQADPQRSEDRLFPESGTFPSAALRERQMPTSEAALAPERRRRRARALGLAVCLVTLSAGLSLRSFLAPAPSGTRAASASPSPRPHLPPEAPSSAHVAGLQGRAAAAAASPVAPVLRLESLPRAAPDPAPRLPRKESAVQTAEAAPAPGVRQPRATEISKPNSRLGPVEREL